MIVETLICACCEDEKIRGKFPDRLISHLPLMCKQCKADEKKKRVANDIAIKKQQHEDRMHCKRQQQIEDREARKKALFKGLDTKPQCQVIEDVTSVVARRKIEQILEDRQFKKDNEL